MGLDRRYGDHHPQRIVWVKRFPFSDCELSTENCELLRTLSAPVCAVVDETTQHGNGEVLVVLLAGGLAASV